MDVPFNVFSCRVVVHDIDGDVGEGGTLRILHWSGKNNFNMLIDCRKGHINF